jgi:undecaprenyl-diphosphatase
VTPLRRPPRATLILLALFVLVSVLVVSGRVLPCDEALLRAIGALRTPERTDLMLAFTLAGDGVFEVPMGLGIALLLWRLGHHAWAKRYLLVGLSGELLYLILKQSFQRPRPEVISRLGEAGWYSYPSGHSMMAPIIWTFGCLLLARTTQHRLTRAIFIATAVIAPVAIGASRLYLGVHYPSDVLGALLIGSAWLVWWWPGASDGVRSASTSAAPAIK